MKATRNQPIKCPDCKHFVSLKTLVCKHCNKQINLQPQKETNMTTITTDAAAAPKTAALSAKDKKALHLKAVDTLKETLAPGTTINMDFRAANLSGTGQRFKALIVKDGGMVNISKDMAHALCARPTKDGSMLILQGTDAESLAGNAVEMLGKTLFGDGSALACVNV